MVFAGWPGLSICHVFVMCRSLISLNSASVVFECFREEMTELEDLLCLLILFVSFTLLDTLRAHRMYFFLQLFPLKKKKKTSIMKLVLFVGYFRSLPFNLVDQNNTRNFLLSFWINQNSRYFCKISNQERA